MSGSQPSVAETLWALSHTPVLFAASLHPHSTIEQVSLKKVSTTASFVSGQKSDTEETSKQKKLKQKEPPWKWQVQ